MTFTYSTSDLTTALAKVRLAIGDIDSDDQLFQDEEIAVYLTNNADDVSATAADLCEQLAVRFSRDYDFSTDDQSFSRSQRASMYLALAKQLRSENSGLGSVATTRVDGYSDDIDSQETSTSTGSRGRVRAGYTDPDLPY